MVSRAVQQEHAAQERAFMAAIYCSRYHRKNRETRNLKTRERMAELRARETTLPPDVLAARREAKRLSAQKYREKNKYKIARKARTRRAAARLAAEKATSNPAGH